MFDAKKFTEALQPPSFIDLDGTAHTGRFLSYEETLSWSERLDKVAFDPSQKADDKRAELRALCDALGLPAEKLMALPRPTLIAALESFFGSPGPEAPPTPS